MAEQQREEPVNHTSSASPRRVTAAGLAELLDLSPDALIAVDRAGIIVQANEQAAALFGYSLQEMVGSPLDKLLPQHLQALHAAHREHYFATPRMRTMGMGLDLFGKRKDESRLPVDISLRPVVLDDVPLAIAAIRDISEQRRSESERVQQAEYIRLQNELIDLAHDAILVCDTASRVMFWNKGAEELYGWSAQEAQGRVTHNLLHTRFPVSHVEIEEQLTREGRWGGELVHTRRDGRVVVVESRQALMRDARGQPTAVLEINRDITVRQQIERETRAAHAETVAHLAFLRQILDALPGSVYLVYGSDARLLLANRAALGVWGAEWHEDQPMVEFLALNGISIFSPQGELLPLKDFATLRALGTGETVLHHQETIRRPNGSLLPVIVNSVALGTTTQWAILRSEGDVSVASAVALEAEPVALVVHQDVSALKEAEYLKDEFIGVAAHELRNPLGALKGFADMLTYQTARGRGPELAEWQREALQEIEQATMRLEKLTEDLLDVTRLQAGRLVLMRKPTDLVDVTRHMLVQAQMTTQRHTLSFETPFTSLMVDVDRVRIEQVLSNLLSNAVKYSPRGGPIEVVLEEEGAAHMALLSVRDQGIGIPADQQVRIFGRFVRAENARATEITGTGLGLYLSRELVEQHGGHLWFESVEGAGTTFFLTLPLI